MGTDEMCATVLRRRERLGISYLMVGDELMEALPRWSSGWPCI